MLLYIYNVIIYIYKLKMNIYITNKIYEFFRKYINSLHKNIIFMCIFNLKYKVKLNISCLSKNIIF